MFKTFLCAAAFALAACTASAADPAPDAWAAWGDNFGAVMSACVAASQSGCLSKAFSDRARPAPDSGAPFVADDLYRDLRTAEVLLHQKDASDAMWKLYGIDSSAYLGTGYSVPLIGPGAKNYEFARQREYFVPNLCAEAADATVCPHKDANIWTWRLTAAQLAQWTDKPIVKLLRTLAPQEDAASFPTLAKANSAEPRPNLPPLLIRFGSLPLAYYKGTFGRPDAVRVFFADYGQVRGETLRGATVATGASTLLTPDPTKTFFIWIYAPDANSKAQAASWKALFGMLSQPQ